MQKKNPTNKLYQTSHSSHVLKSTLFSFPMECITGTRVVHVSTFSSSFFSLSVVFIPLFTAIKSEEEDERVPQSDFYNLLLVARPSPHTPRLWMCIADCSCWKKNPPDNREKNSEPYVACGYEGGKN